MEKCRSVSRVVASIRVRVAGLSSLSSPPDWTSVVWDAFAKLSEVYILLALQARSDVSGEESLCI